MIAAKVKLKLNGHEMTILFNHYQNELYRFLELKSDVSDDTIVLVEHFPRIETAYRTYLLRGSPLKGAALSLPLSNARILHTRFQQTNYHPVTQWILAKLDYQLLAMNMRPKQVTPIN